MRRPASAIFSWSRLVVPRSDLSRMFSKCQLRDIAGAGLAGCAGQRIQPLQDPARQRDIHALDRVVEQAGIHADDRKCPTRIGGVRLDDMDGRKQLADQLPT